MNSPEESFQELFAHLREVEEDPQHKRLNHDILRDAQNNLSSAIPRATVWSLLANGERLLNIIQEDPRPLTRLLEVDISFIPFDEIKDSIPSHKLLEGLLSPSPSIQVLCLAYLRKAADSPSGVAWVGSNAGLVKQFITTWLASDSTEVTERALETLMVLLGVDHVDRKVIVEEKEKGLKGEAQGQGLLWRRLFRDPEIYALFFHWTSLRSPEYKEKSKQAIHRLTISQGRLFDFIARVAELDWSNITASHFPEIEAKYSCHETQDSRVGISLLQYAASGMVDNTDPLMSVLRSDFFMKLLALIDEGRGKQEVPPKLLEAMREDAGETTETPSQATGGIHL
jgi:hypothetical protein